MSLSRMHRTQRWRKLALRTIREEPICRLALPGCTRRSETADHIQPVSTHPHLAYERANTAGACKHCNSRRGNTPWDQLPQLRATLSGVDLAVTTKASALGEDRARAAGKRKVSGLGDRGLAATFFDTTRQSAQVHEQHVYTLGA